MTTSQTFQIGQRVSVDNGVTVQYGSVHGIPKRPVDEIAMLDIHFDNGVSCEVPIPYVSGQSAKQSEVVIVPSSPVLGTFKVQHKVTRDGLFYGSWNDCQSFLDTLAE